MKTLLIVLLCASLTANAVLLVRTPRSHSDSVSTAPLPTANAAAEPTAAATAQKISPELAELLRANNPEGIRMLRALGFSEKVIRRIAVAQVSAQFRDRYRALEGKGNSTEFWKQNYNSFDRAAYIARTEIRREEEAALKKLLGDDYNPDLEGAAQRYGNLPAGKLARVRAIEEDYQSMIMAAQGTGPMSYIRFPEDQEKLSYLQKEKRAELSQVLTPDELFEYDLRTSQSAWQLRYQLSAFEATEQEFRDMFKIAQQAEEHAHFNPNDASMAAQTQRQQMQEEIDQQLKASLSPERYADFKRASDLDYKRFYQIATRLDLPRESAIAAQAVKTSVEERRQQIYDDPTMKDRAQRTQALNALATEAEASLRRILGDSGFQAFSMTQGNFLQRLRPRSMPVRKG